MPSKPSAANGRITDFSCFQARAGRYLILCFEEALRFYDGGDFDNWKWLLRELWQITSTWDIDGWVGRICDASPETILEYRSYQEWNEHKKKLVFGVN